MKKTLERIRMEEKLGRPLLKNEVVFHLSGDKVDNRPENLILKSDWERVIVELYNKVKPLEHEILSLRRELKELRAKPFILCEDEKNDEKTKTEDEKEIPDWIRLDKSIRGVVP